MDINYELLEETKKEINEMFFWKENIEINKEEYEVINDYDQAYENAFEVFYDYEDLDGLSWVDILEENMAKIWEIVFQSDNYAELSNIINNVDIPKIGENYSIDDSDVIDEIEYEIRLCVKSRLVCGKQNPFFESLFKAYKLGGWPCGWNDGKIIVYVPQNAD